MTELKPRPFCGGKAYLGDKMATAMWTAYCGKCVAIEMHDVTRDSVINKWNTRHYPPEVMQAVERMKALEIEECCGKKFGDCPKCGDYVKEGSDCRCGQALDWEEQPWKKTNS